MDLFGLFLHINKVVCIDSGHVARVMHMHSFPERIILNPKLAVFELYFSTSFSFKTAQIFGCNCCKHFGAAYSA